MMRIRSSLSTPRVTRGSRRSRSGGTRERHREGSACAVAAIRLFEELGRENRLGT